MDKWILLWLSILQFLRNLLLCQLMMDYLKMVVYTVMAHPFIGLVIHYTTISCSLQSYRK